MLYIAKDLLSRLTAALPTHRHILEPCMQFTWMPQNDLADVNGFLCACRWWRLGVGRDEIPEGELDA